MDMWPTETTNEQFAVGGRVLVARDATHLDKQIEATVTEIEQNLFVGRVLAVLTDDGIYYFSYADRFTTCRGC